MHKKALQNAKLANEYDNNVVVTDIETFGYDDIDNVKYFNIDNYDEENQVAESFTIYQIGADIYYRPSSEFYQIQEDLKDEVPGQTIENLKYEYTDVSNTLTSYPITDIDNCMFIVSSIFSSLTGDSFDDLTENAKIRRHTKIQADDDLDNSKKVNDAKYGTKDENDFKQELEDKQKKDGTIGALDPQQEESVKPKLPNKNLLTEKTEIEYEVNDKVVYQDEIWDVFSIVTTDDDKQHLKITKNGQVVDIEANKVKPEPTMLKDIIDDDIDKFDLDDKTKLNKSPENEKPEKMCDLNGDKVNCNIVVNNMVLKETLDGERFKAKLSDILEGLDDITVYLGDNDEQTFNKNDISIEQQDWPYAVIASEDDEPLRKIKINPMSFINAEDENDLVDCLIGDKLTQIPKRVIRVMS